MAVFIYNVEKNGKLVRGEIEAKNIQIAQIKLKARKIEPVYIKPKPLIPFFGGGQKVKRTTLLFFTRQLSFLLNSGISLLQSIETCVATTTDEQFKYTLKFILKQLQEGKSFSRCLRTRPDIFDNFYINMVVCAEETGLLDQILQDLANYIEKAEALKSRVKSAMTYPLIVLGVSFSIIFLIVWFVVPKFAALYEGQGGLPALTQAFVGISDALRGSPLLVFGSIAGFFLFLYQFAKTDFGKKQLQAVVQLMPIFGKIQYQAGLVRFFRSFHALLRSGVNFLDAMDVAYNIADHDDVQRGIATARDYVTKGKSLSEGMRVSRAFPVLASQMAKVGEESGKMEQTFEKLTVYYDERLNNQIASVIKMIEPLMIVFLGGVIGIMILALYLPIFNIGSVVS